MVKLAVNNLQSTNQSITHTRCYVSGLRSGMKDRNSIYKALYMMLKEGLNDSKLAHNYWLNAMRIICQNGWIGEINFKI